jgi:hypothetical protein
VQGIIHPDAEVAVGRAAASLGQHRVFPSHRRSCASRGWSPALVPTLLGQRS